MNLSGYTIISGQNCPACKSLMKMMDGVGVKYRVLNREDVPELKIQSIPTVLKDGVRLFNGCPGSVGDLKRKLRG